MPSNFLLPLIVVAAVVSALFCKAFVRRWPQATTGQLVLRSASPLPALIVVLMIAGLASTSVVNCAPDDAVCDGPAMAGAGFILFGIVGSAVTFAAGAAAAWLALHYLLRR